MLFFVYIHELSVSANHKRQNVFRNILECNAISSSDYAIASNNKISL